MGQQRASYNCPNCRTVRLFVREQPNHVLHAILSLLLCGFWLIVWLIVANQDHPFYCSTCGYSDYAKYLADPTRREREAKAAEQRQQAWVTKTAAQPKNDDAIAYVITAVVGFVILLLAMLIILK